MMQHKVSSIAYERKIEATEAAAKFHGHTYEQAFCDHAQQYVARANGIPYAWKTLDSKYYILR